ncbi:MAG: ABC transporter permease [Candidatus Solibacter sp.]
MSNLLRRLRYLLNRRRHDQDLFNDLEFHREMAVRHGGMPLGNALHLREQSRDAWGWTWLERLGQDLRYALRMLRKSPGFTLAAVLMLAIGIGVNVAVFSFFDLMVLRPLNVREPATLLRFHRRGITNYAYSLPYPEAAFFRANTRTLSALIAVNASNVTVEAASQVDPKPLPVNFVTANFFRELGGASRFGRVFDPARDESPAADPVVVLAHGYWQRRFGADPSVIGQTLRLNGQPATIIGVAAVDFSGLGQGINEPAMWAPIARQPYFVRNSRLLTDPSSESAGVQIWGRLAPGQNPKAAEAELHALAAELRRQYPNAIWEDERLPSEPGGFATSMITGGRRGTGAEKGDPVYAIFALAGCLTLLILAVACGNLGSLLLARSVARRREIDIRTAIGAGAGRLIRQLFTESLLLALMGAVAGLGLGIAVLRALFAATEVPGWFNPMPDWRVAAFALGAALLSAILFGLAPALQTGRSKRRPGIARHVLIAAQVAASCILLIVAGLLGRALNHASSAHPGFEYSQVISVNPELGRDSYTPAKAQAFVDTLTAQLRAIPGVESVGLALAPPLGNVTITANIEIDGRPIAIQLNRTDAQFLPTMRIPLLRGRNLKPGDTRAVVISDSLARQVWPKADALGKTFPLDEGYTVVGIAGSVNAIKFGEADSVQAYLPMQAADAPNLRALVRTVASPRDIAHSIPATVRALDPNLTPDVELLSSSFRRRLQGAEYTTLAVTILGGIAQLLACLGILGVVAYAVGQRTREIGIRMALGARPAQVLAVVLRQFTVPVGIGLLIGVAAAAGLSQFLRGRLFGISNLDTATYLGAVALFLITAALSAILPARRALKVDPLTALRHD